MKRHGLVVLSIFFATFFAVACTEKSPGGSSIDASVNGNDANRTPRADSGLATADAPPGDRPDARRFGRPDANPDQPDATAFPDGALGTVCGPSSCTGTDVCCVGFAMGKATYTCQAPTAQCMGGDVACDGPEDCQTTGAGDVCCGTFSGGGGASTTCEAATSCGAGNVVVCHNAADCPNSEKCCPDNFTGSGYSICFTACF